MQEVHWGSASAGLEMRREPGRLGEPHHRHRAGLTLQRERKVEGRVENPTLQCFPKNSPGFRMGVLKPEPPTRGALCVLAGPSCLSLSAACGRRLRQPKASAASAGQRGCSWRAAAGARSRCASGGPRSERRVFVLVATAGAAAASGILRSPGRTHLKASG